LLSNSAPLIPVFVLHWNCPNECLETVQCFLNQDLPLEIWVIDNASDSEHIRVLRDRLPANVNLTQLQENKGWGGGFNTALSRWLASNVSAPYCFVSAHDAIPQETCLRMLLESMHNDSRLGIVCPEYGDASLPKFSPIRCSYFEPVIPRSTGTVEMVDIPHGTLTLYRKQCLAEIGLFDERYFAYGDEYELGLRAQQYHWKVAIVWGAVVLNPGSWTPSLIRHYLLSRNSLLLAQVYGGWNQGLLRSLLMLINSFRILLFHPITKEKSLTSLMFWARLLAIRDFLLRRYGLPQNFQK
jgi:N-acetylglucosaminyl-diphospho-decaprenol L-rhamnosyltransferase